MQYCRKDEVRKNDLVTDLVKDLKSTGNWVSFTLRVKYNVDLLCHIRKITSCTSVWSQTSYLTTTPEFLLLFQLIIVNLKSNAFISCRVYMYSQFINNILKQIWTKITFHQLWLKGFSVSQFARNFKWKNVHTKFTRTNAPKDLHVCKTMEIQLLHFFQLIRSRPIPNLQSIRNCNCNKRMLCFFLWKAWKLFHFYVRSRYYQKDSEPMIRRYFREDIIERGIVGGHQVVDHERKNTVVTIV